MIAHNFRLSNLRISRTLSSSLILVQNLAASLLGVSVRTNVHTILLHLKSQHVISTEMDPGMNKTAIHSTVGPGCHPDYQGARTLE